MGALRFPYRTAKKCCGRRRVAARSRQDEPLGRIDPGKAAPASRQDFDGQPASQVRPGADVTPPSTASLGASPPAQSGTSSPDATKPRKTAKETPTDARAGSDQTPAVLPPGRQQEISRALTASPAQMRCNVDLCAARYKSFNAADCSYQPYGGGPRSFCDVSPRSADAWPQSSRARSEAKDTPIAGRAEEAAKSATPARTGAQCSVGVCAATYKSFSAADCTYQPHGGGPRTLCELSTRSADARPQTSRAATDPRSEAKDTQIEEKVEEAPELAMPARAGVAMQHRCLRGHVQVFPCRGLHLRSQRRRTAPNLRAIDR